MNFISFPPVRYIQGDYYKAVSLGYSGQNTPLGIKIVTGVSYALPILMQERCEWSFKYKMGLPFAFILGVGSYFLGTLWFVSVVLAAVGLLWPTKIPILSRWLEYFGQTVELVVAVDKFGANKDEYYKRTAKQLTGYSQFKSISQEEIEKNLRKWENTSRKWVNRHKDLLLKYENNLKTFKDYKESGL